MALSAALVKALAPERPELRTATRATVAADVRDAVARQLAAAPWHVRLGLAVLGAATGVAAWLLAPGVGLGHQSPGTRRRVLRLLERPGTPTAAVLRVWRTLVALSWLDHPYVLEALDAEAAPADRSGEKS